MSQVTIYLDKETEEKMRAYAKAKNISQSQWIAGLIREKLQSEWPEFVASLAGSWKDFPSLKEIRAGYETDSAREDV